MRILELRERRVPLSRYADPAIPSGGLDTSIVAATVDAGRAGGPVTGYGFASIGRFAQSGLIRERFAPRLLAASEEELVDAAGALDPLRAWRVMMRNEKPGGHGERPVAVGAIDMALWDAAAKLAGLPLWRVLAARAEAPAPDTPPRVALYASGGYRYPADDIARLGEEIRGFLDAGFTRVKIKIGAAPRAQDLARIEAALALLPGGEHLAVDAMNAYGAADALEMAAALAPYRLRWLEDVCDPLDLESWAELARLYEPPLAAGEALFSLAEARLLDRHGGLRPARDILLFDPAHCYGLSHYLEIVAALAGEGWPRAAFWPHGGHLFSLQVAGGLGLGGSEVNPRSFQPFGGLGDGVKIVGGAAAPPEAPGIGFESRAALIALFRRELGA
jgi:L-alanine-DL-glutamate epimerase-like enolase superfamily enzyme